MHVGRHARAGRGHVTHRNPTQQAQWKHSGSAAEDAGRLRKADENAKELLGGAEAAGHQSEEPTGASRPAEASAGGSGGQPQP